MLIDGTSSETIGAFGLSDGFQEWHSYAPQDEF